MYNFQCDLLNMNQRKINRVKVTLIRNRDGGHDYREIIENEWERGSLKV